MRQGVRALNYVHLNHENKRELYEFCSHDYYVGRRNGSWLDVDSGLWFHGGDSGEYERSLREEGIPALERKIAARKLGPRRKIPRGPSTHIARK